VRGLHTDFSGPLRNRVRFRTINYRDKRFTVRGIKRAVDGALGSRGAWMIEPYADMPSTSGFNTDPIDDIRQTAELAVKYDYQLAVHAIGDRGNREVLNVYEETFRRHPDKSGRERRCASSTRSTSTPPISRASARSGSSRRCRGSAARRMRRSCCCGSARGEPRKARTCGSALMKAGALIANGTDAPVEDIDPIPSFHASVTRKAKDGSLFYPAERMTRMEALRSYTINAAYAGFDEDIKGSLRPGKLADVTVFSKDIMTIAEDQIPTAQVMYRIVGGKVEYARPVPPPSGGF